MTLFHEKNLMRMQLLGSAKKTHLDPRLVVITLERKPVKLFCLHFSR